MNAIWILPGLPLVGAVVLLLAGRRHLGHGQHRQEVERGQGLRDAGGAGQAFAEVVVPRVSAGHRGVNHVGKREALEITFRDQADRTGKYLVLQTDLGQRILAAAAL